MEGIILPFDTFSRLQHLTIASDFPNFRLLLPNYQTKAMAVCFKADGTTSGDIPCGKGSPYMCCGDGWDCLTNGLCRQKGTTSYAQASCIDQDFKNCLSFCNKRKPPLLCWNLTFASKQASTLCGYAFSTCSSITSNSDLLLTSYTSTIRRLYRSLPLPAERQQLVLCGRGRPRSWWHKLL